MGHMFHHLQNTRSHLEMRQWNSCLVLFAIGAVVISAHEKQKWQLKRATACVKDVTSQVLRNTEMYFTQCGRAEVDFTRFPWPEIAPTPVTQKDPCDPREFSERSRRFIISLAIQPLDLLRPDRCKNFSQVMSGRQM